MNFKNINFNKCQFDRIEMNHSTVFENVILKECEIATV